MTDDLAAFVKARLDEDEAAAKAAVHKAFRHWHVEPWYDGERLPDGRTVRGDLWGDTGIKLSNDGAFETLTGDHIARHDPARVLREVAAKRAILALHEPDQYGCQVCTNPPLYRACPTLAALVAVWSDHPDYRSEWAP